MDFTFPDLSRETKIDQLLRWQFGSLAPPPPASLASPRASRGSWNRQAEKERQERIESYRAQLEAKATYELDAFYREESATQYSQQQALTEAEEKSRFYNQPNAGLDYKYYANITYLLPDEAVAVLLDKSPEIVYWERLKSCVNIWPFAKKYEQTRTLVSRAVEGKQLPKRISPSVLLTWANKNQIFFPKALRKMLEGRAQLPSANMPQTDPAIEEVRDTRSVSDNPLGTIASHILGRLSLKSKKPTRGNILRWSKSQAGNVISVDDNNLDGLVYRFVGIEDLTNDDIKGSRNLGTCFLYWRRGSDEKSIKIRTFLDNQF